MRKRDSERMVEDGIKNVLQKEEEWREGDKGRKDGRK